MERKKKAKAKQGFQVTVVVICYYFTYCYKCLISVELAADVAKHHHNDESIVDEGNLVTRVYATENVIMRSDMLINTRAILDFAPDKGVIKTNFTSLANQYFFAKPLLRDWNMFHHYTAGFVDY
uniref:Uncharacterized protein n=1 Tax=Glossina pallidipes TaxID=7398 RepID=A0A1A9ZVB7_GLOPL